MIFSKVNFNNALKKYFYNTSWILFEKLFRVLSGLFIGIWIARYLGPSEYGVYSYTISFVLIFSFLSNLGLDQIAVKELTLTTEKLDVISTIFILKLAGSLITILLLSFIVNILLEDNESNFLILIFSFSFLFKCFDVLTYYFQSKVLIKYSSISAITSIVIGALLKLIGIKLKFDIFYFIIILILETIINSMILFNFFKKFYAIDLKKIKFKIKLAKKLLISGLPLIFSSFLIMAFLKFDQIMIKYFLENTSVGYYSAAVRISESYYLIPTAIATSFLPSIVNAKKKNQKIYYSRIKNLISLNLYLSLLMALLIYLIGDWTVNFLFGDNYTETSSILKIHILTGIPVSIGLIWSHWLIIEGKERLIFYSHSIALILNVLLNILLINKIGILGAAYASFISSLFSQFICFFFYKPKTIFKLIFKSLIPYKL